MRSFISKDDIEQPMLEMLKELDWDWMRPNS